MLPSSQMNLNPFESVPADSSRSVTPTPSPNESPNESSSVLSPHTPTFPSADAPLITPPNGQAPDQPTPSSRPPSRSFSSAFVSSPLNPNPSATSPYAFVRPRPMSSRGSVHLSRIASEDSQALGSQLTSAQRGSMVLWRLPTMDDHGALLPPPSLPKDQRTSVWSTASGESIWTLSSDSKYPSGPQTARGGLVPYAWDPTMDNQDATDEDDLLHGPESADKPPSFLNSRSVLNLGVLVLLIGALLGLFIALPVISYVGDSAHTAFLAETGSNTIDKNPQDTHAVPSLIDPDTPEAAKTRIGYDNQRYKLVFSDEFNQDGRTFYPGDDPFWEAVDLWYDATGDLEWYSPDMVYTRNGSLHVRIENVADNGMSYRSGMLQSWNKFCFTGGYIEVSLTLPGPNDETAGYWPGAWTMGNLARAGYSASTDGMWPYSYDSCDVGTLPNQTNPDGLGPAAALYTTAGQAKYNYSLSYLTGQKLSACTCPGEDHPGPIVNNVFKGRGAPEIDILEAEHNKQGAGGVISQSAQFAPFTSNYDYDNRSESNWKVYNSAISWANKYKGSAVQQAISGLTQLPPDVFEGSGRKPHVFGFEYATNPNSPSDGYITWQMDNTPTIRMGAAAVGPDQGQGGSGVGQRLISEEPMSIVLNVAMSPNWQPIDLTTMVFPSEMLVDYVRVYQQENRVNIGCSPEDYPTADYIANHAEAYHNAQLQYWTTGAAGANHSFPRNKLSHGC